MSDNKIESNEVINQIEKVVKEAQSYVVSTVNMVLLKSYLRIGDIISSSKSLTLRELEKELKPKYGEGFSFSKMSRMIKFSQIYSVATLWQHLNWSHYKLLITINYPHKKDR